MKPEENAMGFWMPESGLTVATTMVVIAFIGDDLAYSVSALFAGALTIFGVVRWINMRYNLRHPKRLPDAP